MTALLRDMTTLRLGGPAGRLATAATADEVVSTVRDHDREGEPLLLLAGGSNVVVADTGFPGTVLRIASRGVARDGTTLTVQAGEDWDSVVAGCVQEGLAGVECLSGIPGSTGATPIQNVGAYGQDVAQTIASVTVYDRARDVVERLPPAACAFTYRSSAFKRDPGRWVVLDVTFELQRSALSCPIAYAELARTLDVVLGARAPLSDVRAAVLELRRSKGMVVDPADPDSCSAGSFFTNPILSADEFAAVQDRAGSLPPSWPEPDGRIKTSAAWLVERAGFTRGHGDPEGIAISSKHSLALTNRGRGTTGELVALAREIAAGVHDTFGVDLVPEPVFVGLEW